jgi:glutathione S-transferase
MTTTHLKLTGRSASHFTRVARMIAHELAVPVEFEVIHDLMGLDPAPYGGHPALKLPTLHVAGAPVFGTDHICRTLAALAGRATDPRVVLGSDDALVRNAQELVWHAMAAQVQLVVGVQIAKLPADNPFFAKAAAGLRGALAWLETHHDELDAALPTPRDVSLYEVTLFCLLEHLAFRPTVALDGLPRLRAFAAAYATRPSAIATRFQFDPKP